MPAPSGFQKAKLESEGGVSLPCSFNPSEYSISKANDWTMTPIVGRSLPTMQFAGGHARELTLELLFDAAPDGDVSSATDVLFKMMETDPQLARPGRNQGRPPKVRFVWGTFLSFSAVCSDLSVRFVLFRPDGTPTRAISRLTLLQAEKDARTGGGTPAAPQNPTTRAHAGQRSHTARAGETLQSIAYANYGDAARWRAIARANAIDDPMRLPVGQTLTIPPQES